MQYLVHSADSGSELSHASKKGKASWKEQPDSTTNSQNTHAMFWAGAAAFTPVGCFLCPAKERNHFRTRHTGILER